MFGQEHPPEAAAAFPAGRGNVNTSDYHLSVSSSARSVRPWRGTTRIKRWIKDIDIGSNERQRNQVSISKFNPHFEKICERKMLSNVRFHPLPMSSWRCTTSCPCILRPFMHVNDNAMSSRASFTTVAVRLGVGKWPEMTCENAKLYYIFLAF